MKTALGIPTMKVLVITGLLGLSVTFAAQATAADLMPGDAQLPASAPSTTPSSPPDAVPVPKPAEATAGTTTVPGAGGLSGPETSPAAQHPGPPAQEPDLNSMSIEELMEIEVQTVVSASRYRQKVSEAPSSITIITAEDIRRYGHRTLADILRSVRGFSTTYDRNYHYVTVRGFGRLGDYNTRILLLVDGHRVNDALFDSAAIGTEFILDVDLIERVEVTRGPGSSLYGSNAFFAVVNIVTRGAKTVGREVSAEAGSTGAFKGRLTYGMSGKDDRELLLSASGYTSDGERLYFREFDQRDAFSDVRARNDGFADQGDYDRSRSGYATFEQGGLRLAAAYLERTKGIPTASYGTDFNEPGNRTVDTRGYLDLQYRLRTERGDECTARVYYDHYRYEGDYLYVGTLNKDRAAGTWYGTEARFMTRVLDAHRVIAGAEYEIRRRLDQWNGDAAPAMLYLDDRRRSRAWAAYIQDEITVSPTFLLYAGIRRDEVSTFGGSTNPRLAAIISPVENGTLKLLYGRAFRAPSVYELYYEAPPAMLSNPDLKPETIDTYELVYEHDLGKRLRASVSRYSYSIKNLITQTFDASSGTTSFQNQEKAQATGTELEVQKTWKNGADCRLSYAYQKAEDPNTGDLLENAPKHLAKLGLAVPFLQERLWIGLEEQYLGPRITLAGERTGGVALTNLTIMGRGRARNLEVSFSVYNLTDREYADPVSIDLVPLDTVPQDGRTVRVKLTYAF